MLNINIDIEQKSKIFEKWYQDIVRTYPQDSKFLLYDTTKQFTNPLAYNLHSESKAIFEAIFEDRYLELIEKPLINIIKIRAVQDFSSSEAVGFIIGLKKAFRYVLNSGDLNYTSFLSDIDERVDAIMLKAFDIFMQMRERIYEIKANEIRNRTFRIIERLNEKYRFQDNDIIDSNDK